MSRRGRGPVMRWWPVAVLALLGAWFGHLFEYIRVSGWHAAMAASTTSVHAYFFPAGIGLLAAAAGLSVAAGRAWRVLRARLSAAEWARRAGIRLEPAVDEMVVHRAPRLYLSRLWLTLSVLQLAIWITQENLEAVSAGHRAPGFGVLTGIHALAPVVQAEVALVLASIYFLVHRQFRHLEEAVREIEEFVARRWARVVSASWTPTWPVLSAVTPIERWGSQRWQRPPPAPRSASACFS